jgi:hypothetical protein
MIYYVIDQDWLCLIIQCVFTFEKPEFFLGPPTILENFEKNN